MVDLDALEALVRSGNAYGDGQTTLALIADLRRAQECIDATKNMLGDEKRNPAMRLLGIAQAVITYEAALGGEA